MALEFKTDEEYGYQVSLTEDRDFVAGHNFGFNKTDTEVTVLQKIMDAYIDTTDIESATKFMSHKLDFSISFLDTICLILMEKIQEISALYDEIERQIQDVAHRISKSHLSGCTCTNEEKIEIFDLQTELYAHRRDIKDGLTSMRVLLENMERSRNFFLGMNRRQYNPKSERFNGNPDYQCGPKESKSTELHQTMPQKTGVAISVQRDTKL